MKIRELMKKFDVSRETIRYYREKNFLHPIQTENSYYEYNEHDIALLFQLIKYKYLNNDTFQGINDFVYDNQRTFDMLRNNSQKIINEIDMQIKQLEHLKATHQYRVNYYTTIANDMYSIQHVKNCVGLHYLPFDQIKSSDEIKLMKNIRSYQSLVIPQHEIIAAKKTGYFHPIYCVGITDKNYLSEPELQDCSLRHFYHVKPGYDALRYVVKLNDLKTVPYETLKPVLDYMEKNHLELAASITSIILLVTAIPEKAYYTLFRFVFSSSQYN